MARTRYMGRGTIRWPGHELDGVRCFIVRQLPEDELIVKTRSPGAESIGVLRRVPADRVEREPDA